MFEVLENEILAPNLHRMRVRAPRIAKARKPGQFVIVHPAEDTERVPLTIGDADTEAGTITLFVQAVGATGWPAWAEVSVRRCSFPSPRLSPRTETK
jgi:ferredoxin--NADP+ reductase